MKYLIITVFIFMLTSISCWGQRSFITEEPALTQMMQRWIAMNRAKETVKAWRIQIITTDDRRKMDSARGKFQAMYPSIPLKWEHESPYYKVQIGAYETKMELEAFLLELKEDFPLAIPVVDEIKKIELIRN